MNKVWIWLGTCLALAGCSANETIRMEYYAPNPSASREFVVAVGVADQRSFVKTGDKGPDFIGQYRSGLGIPFDVHTASGLSLADTVARDLRADLAALGFANGAEESHRRIEVIIKDWNFDAYFDTRFSYEFVVEVRDSQGALIVSRPVTESTIVEGKTRSGKKGGFAYAMRGLYRDAVVSLVRENPPVLEALQ